MDRPISAAQVRGARGMLGWSLMNIARRADVSIAAIHRAEGRYPGPVTPGALGAIRVAFETAGVVFLETDDGQHGLTFSPR